MQYQLDYVIDTMSREEILEHIEKAGLSHTIPCVINSIEVRTETLREGLRKMVEAGKVEVSY